MSAKYLRIKQADVNLPAPLRWLTRAFSSISLAVVLLSLVIVYGAIASVPIAMLAKGGLGVLVVVGQGGTALLAGYLLLRGALAQNHRWKRASMFGLTGAVITLGILLTVVGIKVVDQWTTTHPWFRLHRATVIYRLPWLEMTELEFYSWWPMKVILGMFVLNMVWATVRRIEFKFVNIGVLTVHAGIVTIAIGSIFYGTFKIEGDTLLWRRDLGGRPVNYFYDQTAPAIYFLDERGSPLLMLGLHDLPRYNDRDPERGELDIRLHDEPAFDKVFGDDVRATIPGILTYGALESRWADGAPAQQGQSNPSNRAIRIQPGDANGPQGDSDIVLVANHPAGRVIEQPAWALEYLDSPTATRVRDLSTPFEGGHALIVEVPASNFHQAYPITDGQEIRVGDTGYVLTIRSIGPYPMSFASEGYEGARDTQATVQVHDTNTGAAFRRITLFRYPERTQDFVPAPDDPTVGPMGKRQAPSPAIRLTYIDASKLQYWLMTDPVATEKMRLLARAPGEQPVLADLKDRRILIPSPGNAATWVYVTEMLKNAIRVPHPTVVPKSQRKPKDEGTYMHAVLPVDLQADLPGQTPWKQRVWLTHMRYPEYPDGVHGPMGVDLPIAPGVTKKVYLVFSRVRRELPFALAMDAFEMQPYKGTDIPRDYVADLSIVDLDPDGRPIGPVVNGKTRLNNPLIHQGIKLSQTGWDPGDRNDPNQTARDDQGRFINQQRYSIIGVGNNVGIRAIFIGSCAVTLGIPWAFYIKPLLVRRKSHKLRRRAAEADQTASASAKSAA